MDDTGQRVIVSADLHRREALVSQAASRLLLWVQAAVEDVQGALEAGWPHYALHQARFVLMECLGIRGILRGGDIDWADDDVAAAPDATSTEGERRLVSALLDAGATDWRDAAATGAWFGQIQDFVRDTEVLIGLDEPLPVLRSPEGMFRAIRLVREESALIEQLGLPRVIPAEWADDLDGPAISEGG